MHANSFEAIEEAATEWVARIDRGLTRAEQSALAEWLAEDTRCREAFDLAQTTWKNLDRAQVFRIAAIVIVTNKAARKLQKLQKCSCERLADLIQARHARTNWRLEYSRKNKKGRIK